MHTYRSDETAFLGEEKIPNNNNHESLGYHNSIKCRKHTCKIWDGYCINVSDIPIPNILNINFEIRCIHMLRKYIPRLSVRDFYILTLQTTSIIPHITSTLWQALRKEKYVREGS